MHSITLQRTNLQYFTIFTIEYKFSYNAKYTRPLSVQALHSISYFILPNLCCDSTKCHLNGLKHDRHVPTSYVSCTKLRRVQSCEYFYSDYGVGFGLFLARLCDITINFPNLGSQLRIASPCAPLNVTSHTGSMVLQDSNFKGWVSDANSLAVGA